MTFKKTGGKTAAALHVARAVCRRAERSIVPLVKSDELEGEVLKYMNRLSDFLFVLARHASRLDNKEENIYIRPGKFIKIFQENQKL